METESHSDVTPYDEVAYPCRAHQQTHPDLLATLGRLFGMQPAPVDHCSVLEIGCGDGTNLIPMAYSLPGSRFLGFDLAGLPVAQGCSVVQKLGLANVTLSRQDLMDFALDSGPFDYIIAHGFYSWVPLQLRDRVLEACRATLSPHGIAYISYNCYPGGYLRRMLREMMRFHVQRAPDPATKIGQAKALLGFLADAPVRTDEYHQILKKEWAQIQQRDAGGFYHDDLAEVNQPVYFHQFVEHAGRHGLQFLAEAEYFMMQDRDLTQEARQALEGLESDRLLREQYLDFIRFRRFRQTLLCREEVPLRSGPDPAVVPHLRAASSARVQAAETGADPAAPVNYCNESGGVMTCGDAASKAVLKSLTEAWPHSLVFRDLAERVGEAIPAASPQESESLTVRVLLSGYGLGMVELRTFEPLLAFDAGCRPVCSPVARLQLSTRDVVTNLRHASVGFQGETMRRLVPLMDGTLDRAELAVRLRQINPDAESIDLILDELIRLALLLPSAG